MPTTRSRRTCWSATSSPGRYAEAAPSRFRRRCSARAGPIAAGTAPRSVLLAHALGRIVDATAIVRARFVVDDAIDERAVGFSEHHGFRRVSGTMRLAQKLSTIAKALGRGLTVTGSVAATPGGFAQRVGMGDPRKWRRLVLLESGWAAVRVNQLAKAASSSERRRFHPSPARTDPDGVRTFRPNPSADTRKWAGCGRGPRYGIRE